MLPCFTDKQQGFLEICYILAHRDDVLLVLSNLSEFCERAFTEKHFIYYSVRVYQSLCINIVLFAR